MRVTFVLPGYPSHPTGGARVVYEYANRLAQRNHFVSVVHVREMDSNALTSDPRWRDRARLGLAHLRNRLSRPRVGWHRVDPRVDLRFVPRLEPRYLPDADVILPTWWATAEIVFRFPPMKGVPVHLIQGFESWGGQESRVVATWRAPARKVVVARWLYDKGLRLGVPAGRMRHIPNGIDHDVFRVTRSIAHRPPRVAALYHPAPGKGAAEAVAALVELKRRRAETEAVLFGAKRRPGGLPRWIEYRADPRQQELVQDVYNGSAVFLSSSRSEGWGLTGAEAMACGCALVSTRNGGVSDYAQDGETALLVPVGDRLGLVERVERLLGDDALRARLAARGHRNIQSFTWERSTDLLEEWCRRVVATPAAARP